jgi:RNA polymerase primary sigma factor
MANDREIDYSSNAFRCTVEYDQVNLMPSILQDSYIKKSVATKISKDDELDVIRLAQQGDKKLKELIVNRHSKLVIHIAKKYKNAKGIEMDDLIQEGMIGLLKAFDKFIPDKGNKFSTYATFWINQTVRRAIQNKSNAIRVPISTDETILKMLKVSSTLGLDIALENEKYFCDVMKISAVRFQEILSIFHNKIVYSMDTFSLNHTDESLDIPEVLDDIYYKDYSNIYKALQYIPEQDRTIICLSFGLEGQKFDNKKLCEVFNVTPHRFIEMKREAISLFKFILTLLKDSPALPEEYA